MKKTELIALLAERDELRLEVAALRTALDALASTAEGPGGKSMRPAR